MAYAFIQSATGRSVFGSLDIATTDAANMTGADTLFLLVTQSTSIATDATITDSVGGNTWEKVIRSDNAEFSCATLFRCAGASVSSSMTVTAEIDNNGCAFGLVLLGFSGGHATPDNLTESNSADGVTSIAAGSSSLTPSLNDCVVIAGMAPGVDQSIDGGFSIVKIDAVGGESWGAAAGYLIQTTAAAVNPTFSWSGTTDAATVLASFRPATGATPRRLLLSTPA